MMNQNQVILYTMTKTDDDNCSIDSSESVISVTKNAVATVTSIATTGEIERLPDNTTLVVSMKSSQTNCDADDKVGDEVAIVKDKAYDIENFIEDSSFLVQSNDSKQKVYYHKLSVEPIDHSERFFGFKRLLEEDKSSNQIQSIESADIHLQFAIRNRDHQYVTPNSIDFLTVATGTNQLDNGDPSKCLIAEYGDIYEWPYGIFICATRFFTAEPPVATVDETIILNFLIIPLTDDIQSELYSIKSIELKEFISGEYECSNKLKKDKTNPSSFFSYLTYLEDIKKTRWIKNNPQFIHKEKLIDSSGSIPPDNNSNNNGIPIALITSSSVQNNQLPVALAVPINDNNNSNNNNADNNNSNHNNNIDNSNIDNNSIIGNNNINVDNTMINKNLNLDNNNDEINNDDNNNKSDNFNNNRNNNNNSQKDKNKRRKVDLPPREKSVRNSSEEPSNSLQRLSFKQRTELNIQEEKEKKSKRLESQRIREEIENAKRLAEEAEEEAKAQEEERERLRKEKLEKNRQSKLEAKRKKEEAEAEEREEERKKEVARVADKVEREAALARQQQSLSTSNKVDNNNSSLAPQQEGDSRLIDAMTKMGGMFAQGFQSLSEKLNSATAAVTTIAGTSSIILPANCNKVDIIKTNSIEERELLSGKKRGANGDSPPSSPDKKKKKKDKKKSKKKKEVSSPSSNSSSSSSSSCDSTPSRKKKKKDKSRNEGNKNYKVKMRFG